MTKRIVFVLALLTLFGSALWGQNEPRMISGRADTMQALLEDAGLPLLPQRIIGRKFCVTLPERSEVTCGVINSLNVGANGVWGWTILGVESSGSREGELLRLEWASSRNHRGWSAKLRDTGTRVTLGTPYHAEMRFGEPPQVTSTRAVGLELLDEH